MLESTIQDKTIAVLALHGFLAFPIEYRNRRNCPDLMAFALGKPCQVAFIEMKKPKGKTKPGQIDNAKLFATWGHDVGFCRSPEEALAHCRKVFYANSDEEASRQAAEKTVRPTDVLQRPNKDNQISIPQRAFYAAD